MDSRRRTPVARSEQESQTAVAAGRQVWENRRSAQGKRLPAFSKPSSGKLKTKEKAVDIIIERLLSGLKKLHLLSPTTGVVTGGTFNVKVVQIEALGAETASE